LLASKQASKLACKKESKQESKTETSKESINQLINRTVKRVKKQQAKDRQRQLTNKQPNAKLTISKTSNSVHHGHFNDKCKQVINKGVQSLICHHTPGQMSYRFQFIIDK